MKDSRCYRFLITLLAILSVANLAAWKHDLAPRMQPANSDGLVQQSCQVIPIPHSAVHHGQEAAPHMRIAESTSGNWSGYAAQSTSGSGVSGSVSDVQGSWIVPTVTGSKRSTTYSSFWVGIDGYSDGTVEQLGTESDWTSKGQKNYAWFEMYPAGAYMINGFPVGAGDTIAAGVTYTVNNVYQLAITNFSRNVYFLVPTSYTTSSSGLRTSAEWIAEAPSSRRGVLPLANFGTGYFLNCQATISGTTGPIDTAGWFVDPLTMIDPKGGTATPSGITDTIASPITSSFTVTYH